MFPESAKAYTIDHLISKRAINRSFNHFNKDNSEYEPEGFEPHPKPLGLGYGRPNPQYYPIKKIIVALDDYPFQDSLFRDKKYSESSIEILRDPENPDYIGIDQAFQYGELNGLSAFSKFVQRFVDQIHQPAYDKWSTIATNGAGDGMNKAADAIIDEGDIVLLEEFTFTPFINSVLNAGGIAVPTKLDLSGTDAKFDITYLSNLLKHWDTLRPEYKGRKPKALYIIPTCQNPTGLTQSIETRKQIYQLASVHDFIIIEDDPYGYLSLPPFSEPNSFDIQKETISVDEYLRHHFIPSYLSFDIEGRVIRIETFSKVFSPGLRLGYLVGHENIIKVIRKNTAIGSRSPSGPSQLILLNIINQKLGGIRGWLEWILKMRLAYTHRRNILISSLIQLKSYHKGYFRILSSDAGMFTSIIVNFPQGINIISKLELLNYKLLQHGVTVVLGHKLAVDTQFSEGVSNFLRLSYAELDTDVELTEASRRLTTAIEEFFEKGFRY